MWDSQDSNLAAPSFSLETTGLCCCWCHETAALLFKVLGQLILWRITTEDAPQNLTFLWRTPARMRHRIFLRPLTCGPSLRRPLLSQISQSPVTAQIWYPKIWAKFSLFALHCIMAYIFKLLNLNIANNGNH